MNDDSNGTHSNEIKCSKQYGLRNVTGLPKIFCVILAQYCGHYFFANDCMLDEKNETRCEGWSVQIHSNEGWIILVLGLINA